MNIRSREQIKADYADKASGVHENKFIFAPPPGIYEEYNMSETRYFFYQFMHSLFWRTLCPQPDGNFNMYLRGWPYNFTGRIAGYFHTKVCKRCQ